MPTQIGRELNDTTSALWTSAEINGGTNPFLGITFEVDSSRVFQFLGITCNVGTGTAVNYNLAVYGIENFEITPQDNFQGLLARIGNGIGRGFYRARRHVIATLAVDVAIVEMFAFSNARLNTGKYSFFVGLDGVAAPPANFTADLTVYGRVINLEDRAKFPYEFR